VEAKHLAERFVGVNQAQFARTYAVPGGASMVNQHIKGHRPINLKAANAYATGFGCTLAEISPRLAAEVSKTPDSAGRNPEPFGLKEALSVLDEAAAQADEKRRKAAAALLAVYLSDPQLHTGLLNEIAATLSGELPAQKEKRAARG